MLYAIVEADSHDAAAKSFVGHPHLGIPEASIEIMEIHPLPGMAEREALVESREAHASFMAKLASRTARRVSHIR